LTPAFQLVNDLRPAVAGKTCPIRDLVDGSEAAETITCLGVDDADVDAGRVDGYGRYHAAAGKFSAEPDVEYK